MPSQGTVRSDVPELTAGIRPKTTPDAEGSYPGRAREGTSSPVRATSPTVTADDGRGHGCRARGLYRASSGQKGSPLPTFQLGARGYGAFLPVRDTEHVLRHDWLVGWGVRRPSRNYRLTTSGHPGGELSGMT